MSENKVVLFYEAVLKMRSAQKNYFHLRSLKAPKTHTEKALTDSKAAEKKVDDLLETFNKIELL